MVLFATLAAVIVASVALAVVSNVARGPASNFELVPTRPATSAELVSDAGSMVRRLQSLGFKNTQARANAGSIEVTMYGSADKVRAALLGALATGSIKVRPVECAAPLLELESQIARPKSPQPLVCGESYLLTAGALKIDTDTGQPARLIGPDPAFATVASTSDTHDASSATVLLPTGKASGFEGERLVCGPAEVVGSDVASAGASYLAPEWSVDLTLTASGATKYEKLTKSRFHAYMAIEVDGTVISAPLVEPTQSSYGSLGTKIQIVAGLTMNQAVDLADDLTSPLAVPLELSR
jgi:preprotein translocase subunit SecD